VISFLRALTQSALQSFKEGDIDMATGKIGGGAPHNILVTTASDDTVRAETNKQLDHLLTNKTVVDKFGGKENSLVQSRFQRFIVSIPKRLSFSYDSYVGKQNALIKESFVRALSSKNVEAGYSQAITTSLDKRIATLNRSRDILKFEDLEQVLSIADTSAKKELLSYLPASNGKQSQIDAPTDGAKFKALAAQYKLDTPEKKERFRTALEGRIFSIANSVGSWAAQQGLASIADSAAARASFDGIPPRLDKSLNEILDEYPPGLENEKFLQDGSFQLQGYPDDGAQSFVFFKRLSDEGVPYDEQQFYDLHAAKNGRPEKADTPAAKGQLADVPQKFHFSVPSETLANNKAWAPLHQLLTSDENPFNQWKISNHKSLQQQDNAYLAVIEKKWTDGWTVTDPETKKTKTFESIPKQRDKVDIERQQLELRRELHTKGEISDRDFKKFELQFKDLELEVQGHVDKLTKQKRDCEDTVAGKGRLVGNAQFTLYTQHEKGKDWKPEEVKKYTDFLLKLEKTVQDLGIEPDQLPASYADVPGLRFATFRDEAISDAAEARAKEAGDKTFNYQAPPESLLQEYRDTPFYKLASQEVAKASQEVAKATEVRVTV
jgi:hypothetical protein